MNTGDKLGRYELGQRIGEGAMSEVFASRHPLLERDVAIKVLKKEVCSDQQYVARFLDDARSAHALTHPNIVRVLDVDDSEAQPFIVMDLVDGQPLDEWRKGWVDMPVAVKIARDVAGALAAAHAGGLIHRDVKPSNVLLERKTKKAKLTDFGAAKREREGGAQLTQMGQRIGTPRYMAPEQVEGGEVSKCTDLFALGALLYELLAGKPAFEGESVSAVYHGILFKDPTPLREVRPEVPESLAELVERLLAKKPEDRPASAEDVVAALDALDQAAPSGVARGVAAATADATLVGEAGRTSTGRTSTGATSTGATSTGATATGTDTAGATATRATSTGAAGGAPGTVPPPPPYRDASRKFGAIMQSSRLVPVAAGLVLLLVVVAGGFWAFSGGDAPGEPDVADATPEGAGGEPGAGQEVAAPAPVEEPAPPEIAGDDDAEGAPAGPAGAAEEEGVAEEDAVPEEEPADVAAAGPTGGDAQSGQPTFAQSLREQDQQAGNGGTPDGATGGDAQEAEPGDQDLAGLAEEDRPGGDEPAQPESDAATVTGAPPEPDREEATGGGPDDQQPGGAAEETDLAAVRTDEAPDVPRPDGAGTAALDCSGDEPGCAFAETVLAAVEPEGGATPEIFLNKEDGVYLDQEYLVVEVAMPEDLGGYLYLDVYTDNGEVFHLLPEPLRVDNELDKGAMIRVGVEEDERASGVRHWQISGPFGTGYLAALVTENRLFDDLRPIGETIDTYRQALLDALDDPSIGRTALSLTPVEFRAR